MVLLEYCVMKHDLQTLVDSATRWQANDPDPQTQRETQALIASRDAAGLLDRFGTRLGFGTAGLRGLLGAGPNRMNRLVVQQTSAGLGRYLLDTVPQARERGVVVGFDGRRGSHVFALDAAGVFAALGFHVYLFAKENPTPVAGFAVRQKHAAVGVVITASHNPPDYNGYKVYWGNGAQIIPPHDANIAHAIDVAATQSIKVIDVTLPESSALLTVLSGECEESYLQAIGELSLHHERDGRADFAIAYTPLHGVGAPLAEAVLARAGFAKVHTVAEQREPDGRFPTVRFPNPEEPGAMDLVLALAKTTHAALACANDPDADRLAVAAPTADGAYRMLTGDQIGILLAYERMQKAPSKSVVATTIVSSRLLSRMAQAHGVSHFTTLTGFKWLANGMLEQSRRGMVPLLAYEEALGYGVGSVVWDKDGISALLAFAEMACAWTQTGQTLWGTLEKIYRTHGLFVTGQQVLQISSDLSGMQQTSLGEKLRRHPPHNIAGRAIVAWSDLEAGTSSTGEAPPYAKSDVLMYTLDDDSRVIVRPSGTEPKIKCYYEIRADIADHEAFSEAETRAQATLAGLVRDHQAALAIL